MTTPTSLEALQRDKEAPGIVVVGSTPISEAMKASTEPKERKDDKATIEEENSVENASDAGKMYLRKKNTVFDRPSSATLTLGNPLLNQAS
jgi:hypothetical protein